MKINLSDFKPGNQFVTAGGLNCIYLGSVTSQLCEIRKGYVGVFPYRCAIYCKNGTLKTIGRFDQEGIHYTRSEYNLVCIN